ncbi:IclR family transcriptional regulator [Caproiciproducens sp. NJN-50]|uniref:IclR family transcriptional regulator n=1 Tax=Acutalibacteraceae TaxID=3082771 RepID=UPI000FFDFE30|nr:MULTISPECIES: IclR family transcriptional regulator [Acutalibacteraceae]QAT50722.1 IclR family transcriptional regulator [Caproiciproducens sp. NJN-50]
MKPQNITVPALERALNILEYLAKANRPVTLKTLAGDLDIPIASAFRLVKNLVSRGYVKEHAGGQTTYVLGGQISFLAVSYEQGISLQAKAEPFMRDLAEKLKQTVQLAVMKNGTLQYISQTLSASTTNVNVVAPLYTPLNIHTSAAGKILFSYLSGEQQTECLHKMQFTRATEKTITDAEAFVTETIMSRQHGYAVDMEEYAKGIGCLAIPVFSRDTCVAALGITGSISNYKNTEHFSFLLQQLQKSAEELSQTLLFYA